MLRLGIDISPITSSVRTGVGEYTYGLLNALFNIDTQNQYFLFYNAFLDVTDSVPQWNAKNIHFVKTRWPNKIFHTSIQLLGIPKIDRLIEKKNNMKLDYFFSPNIGFQALSKQTKHILTVHDLSFEIFPECFSPKMRLWHSFLSPKKQCQNANKILTPSQNTKRDLEYLYGIDPQKIQVLTPGLENTFWNQKIDADHEKKLKEKYLLPEKYILFFGTLEPRKNIEAVLGGFELFQKKCGAEYKLVIAGAPGWKNTKILSLIEKNKNVQYIGYVQPEDKSLLYLGASLFVYPSLYEGFGFPVLEAMASGVPVITSNRSSLPEIAENAAYFVNPYNTSEIALGMEKILCDLNVSQYFIQKGKEQVQKFHWKKTAEQFLSLLV